MGFIRRHWISFILASVPQVPTQSTIPFVRTFKRRTEIKNTVKDKFTHFHKGEHESMVFATTNVRPSASIGLDTRTSTALNASAHERGGIPFIARASGEAELLAVLAAATLAVAITWATSAFGFPDEEVGRPNGCSASVWNVMMRSAKRRYKKLMMACK